MKSKKFVSLSSAMLGFVCGAVLFGAMSRTPTVSANPQTEKRGGGIVHVYLTDTSWSTGKFLSGNVVGFSCVPATPGEKYTECYVVTQ